jgi:FKBP-type peptidyl-prolyl cis-trans isomerase FklB
MYVLGSCTSFTRKSEWKTDIDTLSYFWGMARAEGIKNYLTMQAGVDTNYMEAFYKGFRDGAKHYGPEDIAYMEGKRIALMINNQWYSNMNSEIFLGDSGLTLNRHLMLSGFYQGVRNNDDAKTMQAQSYSQMMLERVKDGYKRTKFADLIAVGEKLLADNAGKADIQTTSSGLQYRIVTEGTGALPGDRAKVKVNYRGTLADGTEFDSSYKNGAPTTFRVNSVIRGWTEALKMMPVGSKWELFIPQDLAYGTGGQLPTIPPYSTLIFEVELLEIEPD